MLARLGLTDSEASAVQGARPGEAHHHLQHDDIATLRLARAGLDGIQGTSDDYRSRLVYAGRYSNPQGEACQIPVRFDSSAAFASTSIGSYRMTPNHWGILSVRMRFNPAVNWFLPTGASTVTSIVSDLPDPSNRTQPITVRVNIAKAAGNPIAMHPLGVIEVRDGLRSAPDTAYCTITLAGTAGETGERQLLPLIGGNKLLTAEYLGDGGFDASRDTEAHTVTGAVQFSAISSSSAPVAVGAPLDIRWTLAPPFGAPPIAFGGSVVVKDAADCAAPPSDPAHQCSALLPANQCRITFQSAGPRNLALCYAGDGAATPATATFAQNVIAGVATTTRIVALTPSDAAPLAPVTVSVAVDETTGQGGHPAGVIEVRDGAPDSLFTARCQISLQGNPGESGDCTLIPLQAGTRTLSVGFAAQGRWAASSATVPLTVGALRIARLLPNISRRGQGVTVMVDLDVSPFLSDPLPSGLLTVSDGVDSCQIALPRNECVWYGSTPGIRTLTATWAGDANLAGRTSAPVSQQVLDTPADLELLTPGVRAYADANGASAGNASALSADGGYAVFLSDATNFVPGDTNGLADIFGRDQKSGLIRRVNTSSSGEQANGICTDAAISANGRYVAFSSLASNLMPGDTNNVRDVFLKDLATGSLVRVSVHADGSQATVDNEFTGMPLSISADRRYVAFLTFARLLPRDTNIHSDVYVKDMLSGELDLVSTASDETLANFRNHSPSISPDGRYVAFASQASNFVPEDSTITMDIDLKDRVTRSIRLVSSNAAGTSGGDDISVRPVVSTGGRYVAFMSYAHNLITPDINYTDIYVKDMQTGAIERANTTAAGAIESNDANLPSISADGRYVAFQSKFYGPPPTSMTRIYIKDRQSGAPMRGDRLSTGVFRTSGISLAPAISADGRFVSFHSASTGFVSGDVNGLADIYVHQRSNGLNQRAALPGGVAADGASAEATLSRDGRYVAFVSAASNLLAGDDNGRSDVFVKDLATGGTVRVNLAAAGQQGSGSDCSAPALSGDGQRVGFVCAQAGLVGGLAAGTPHAYVKQLADGTIRLLSANPAGEPANAPSSLTPPALSDSGLLVFSTAADTLISGDAQRLADIFVTTTAAPPVAATTTITAHVPDPTAQRQLPRSCAQRRRSRSVVGAVGRQRDAGDATRRTGRRGRDARQCPGQPGVRRADGQRRCGHRRLCRALWQRQPARYGIAHRVGGLTNGVPVTCSVAAVNDVGEGPASAPSASVTPATVPDAPTAVVATRGNAQFSVAFTPPTVDGGSAVTGYTASCGSGSQNGSAPPIAVTGLTNGSPVSCRITARNEIGESTASAPSSSVTPATVPATPQLTTAASTSGGTGAVLSFTAPDSGGSAITGYEARCTPGTHAASGTASPLTVAGLTITSTYACTVSAHNELGTGSASNSVNITPRIQADLAISNANGRDFISGGSRPDWLVEVNNASGNTVPGARMQMTLPA